MLFTLFQTVEQKIGKGRTFVENAELVVLGAW